eukprot:CAMPEP_0202406130 /NCGR_PEP_ID=MMETSP1128-20130828/8191_1 /ASSEMBLY_ACC=CAM_ASM_000463 /TAXON_ID=3047 /ORGANISM="Dunaliella tertiolecta, Strain CCMP1320" /LENGTH=104 /DNA_ID=CAMNT_0049010893 /DNA_START=537 /DNA_END=851 /DNA_ORIENTATION=+
MYKQDTLALVACASTGTQLSNALQGTMPRRPMPMASRGWPDSKAPRIPIPDPSTEEKPRPMTWLTSSSAPGPKFDRASSSSPTARSATTSIREAAKLEDSLRLS